MQIESRKRDAEVVTVASHVVNPACKKCTRCRWAGSFCRISKLSLASLMLLFITGIPSIDARSETSPHLPLILGRGSEKPSPFRHLSVALSLRGGGPAGNNATGKRQITGNTPRKSPQSSRNVNFLIRLLFLSFYGSLGSIMPYLPVYYDSLGHGGQIIGLLGAVKPATTFLVAPLWGMLADQSQKPFLILQVTFLVSFVGQLLMGVRQEASYIMFMVFITALFNAPVKSLLDSMVLDHIPHRSSYGRLRLWGQMGFGLASSTVGLLLSKSVHREWPETTSWEDSPWPVGPIMDYSIKCWHTMTGYKLLFLSYAALSVPTWLCIQIFRRWTMQAEQEKSSVKQVYGKSSNKKKEAGGARIGEGLSLLIHNRDCLLFFLLVLVVGISSGLIENFAYVRMREVGGTGKEMGLSRLVSSLAGAPMFWFSGKSIKFV